ncbi:MAG TPA: hypothetical protein VIU82_24400 [Bosea sp. (in: a-proteobacteria)]
MGEARFRELALLSVSRGCAFAGLAIICVMVGLAGYPGMALQSGAILMMLAAAVLILKAERSQRVSYKRTELWVLLDPKERPRADFAQQVIGLALREVYLRFARYFAAGGAFCFVGSLALLA